MTGEVSCFGGVRGYGEGERGGMHDGKGILVRRMCENGIGRCRGIVSNTYMSSIQWTMQISQIESAKDISLHDIRTSYPRREPW